ncbi:MAG: type II toxin-antitoxin system CcdA family antitoxin [Thiopseudomonas sp.]
MTSTTDSKKRNASPALSRPCIKCSSNYSAAKQWQIKNTPAIAAYNEMIVQHGVFSDSLRNF